jgi:YD repeat-containing protein
VETVTDPNGIVTTLSYDGRNRQLSTTRNGVSQSRTYNAAGEIDAATDALGRTMDYTYNAAGFVEKIIDPSGNFIYYGYNSIGKRTEESIFGADNVQTHYRGTDWGNPATNPELAPGKPWKSLHRNAADSANLETVYAYDDAGNLASVTDAEGKATTYHYDLFSRLYQVVQPGNATTTYAYDRHGNLSSVTDAEGHVTAYDYDDLGRLAETDSPDTGTTRCGRQPALQAAER